MENIEQKWIEAVSILITNSSEKVLCPFCKKACLNVMDIFLDDDNPQKGIERYIICENCKRQEAVLLKKSNLSYGVIQNNNIWFKYLNIK